MSEKLFFELLSKQLAGEASRQELQQLKKITDENPAWKQLYMELNYQTEATTPEDILKAEQAYALHDLKMHLQQESVPAYPGYEEAPTPGKWRKGALVLLCVVFAGIAALGWHKWYGPKPAAIAQSQVVTKKGSKTNVKLPDGTTVWINADSRLEYADNFKGKTREVWLTGEAFFDVAKDEQHPFIIHTEKISIKVLGTAFNVKSYPEDKVIETSLLRGKIEVSFNDSPTENIILHPNEKLTVRKDQSTPASVSTINDPHSKIKLEDLNTSNNQLLPETAWINNKIAFTDEPMSEIAKMLERRFNIEVSFADKTVMTYRYTGIFEEEDLNEILLTMQLSRPFNYTLNGKRLSITH